MAKVFRVGRLAAVDGHAFGFTDVVDIDWGPDGSLYVVELAAQGLLADTGGPPVGSLYRIHPDGTRELLSGSELVLPGGVVVAGNNAVYVSINSTSADAGRVLRYAP
jgi:sugar lactone lactonase YvrE